MGRVILVEGLDLAGKSTLVRGLEERLSGRGWQVRVRHGDLCQENPVAKVTRQMMRWDPGFQPSEGAPLFLASHLWDLRNFQPPRRVNGLHLQDSCALRSLAFERVLGKEFYAQQLEEVVDQLPVFDAAYVLTASMKNRKERFMKRQENDLHDSFMLSDPVRFARVDSELLRLGVEKCRAKLVCTDEFDAEQLLDYVWNDLQNKLGWSHRSVA
jgi:thymidylate kinase